MVGENLGFIAICLGIFAALFFISLLYEKFVCKNKKSLSSTHYISYTAIFSCMAGILMLVEIPLFFAPAFYKIDLSEIPVFICTFYLGPVAGVVTELIKIMIKLVLKGTTTAFVGDFANFAVGCSFVLPASMIYHARQEKKTALAGMIIGTLIMTIFGSAFNAIYLLPKFSELYGMPLDTIVEMGTAINPQITSVSSLVFFAVVPFNLLKGVIVTTITFFLYKRISPVLHKGDKKKKNSAVQS